MEWIENHVWLLLLLLWIHETRCGLKLLRELFALLAGTLSFPSKIFIATFVIYIREQLGSSFERTLSFASTSRGINFLSLTSCLKKLIASCWLRVEATPFNSVKTILLPLESHRCWKLCTIQTSSHSNGIMLVIISMALSLQHDKWEFIHWET